MSRSLDPSRILRMPLDDLEEPSYFPAEHFGAYLSQRNCRDMEDRAVWDGGIGTVEVAWAVSAGRRSDAPSSRCLGFVVVWRFPCEACLSL